MSRKEGTSPSSPSSSLSLPTANTARQHLDSKKKSSTKQVHPGYSMFDWNKVCNSGNDMSGTKGQLLQVSHEELARHCTEGDLWTAVRGVVYNVTLFTKFHPGGKGQLMRGAGLDCTELFDKIHVWVNSEAILEKCMVGYLVGSKPPKKSSSLNVSVSKPPFPGESSSTSSLGTDVLSLQVPGPGGFIDISNAGESNTDSNMEEGSRLSGEDSDDVDMAMAGISLSVPSLSNSVQSTANDISIPVPVSSAEIAVSPPIISIPVPPLEDNSVPISISKLQEESKSLATPTGAYITNHPLISKTAYETSV